MKEGDKENGIYLNVQDFKAAKQDRYLLDMADFQEREMQRVQKDGAGKGWQGKRKFWANKNS